MAARRPDEGRGHLRRLDLCLEALEDANERNEETVTPSAAFRLQPYLPAIVAGMRTSQAIELVLAEQARLLAAAGIPRARPGGGGLRDSPLTLAAGRAAPLDKKAARDLTERIKHATRQICMLLLEAHARAAWSALGYRSWEQYVRTEFGISRSRSYQLLDQGRVISAIQSSAGVSCSLSISAYTAEQIKPRLTDIVAAVRERSAGRSETEVQQIVAEVIQAHRPRRAGGRDRRVGERDGPARPELARLYDAIDNLTSMPGPSAAAAMVPRDDGHRLSELDAALNWLSDFVDELDRRWRDDRSEA